MARKILAAVLSVIMVLGMMSAYATEDIVEIGTKEALVAFAEDVNSGNTYEGKTVKLTADIDLKDVEWKAIGENADGPNKFMGIFDGDNHKISNLAIDTTVEEKYQATGFFGALNGTAKNIVFEKAVIKGFSDGVDTDNGIAVVAGSLYPTGNIENVTVNDATVSGNRYVGGIVGYCYGSVKNCKVNNITASATPNLVETEYDNGDMVGGAIGYMPSGANDVEFELSNVAVDTATITAYCDFGGLVGYADSKIEDCSVKSITLTQDLTNGYKDETPTTFENLVGKKGSAIKILNCIDGTTPVNPYTVKNGEKRYLTLKEALSDVESEDTITLLGDIVEDGFKNPSGKNITLDLNKFKYTITGNVGSEGTVTSGIQLLKDSTVVIKNGEIYSNTAKFLVQNYANLTLDNVKLSGEDLQGELSYVLSNNNGEVVIKDTIIKAGENDFAFDACDYSSYKGVTVTVEGLSQIDGKIEATDLNGGENNAEIIVKEGATFTEDIEDLSGTVTLADNVILIQLNPNYEGAEALCYSKAKGCKYETLPTVEERSGYNFKGWYKEAELTNAVATDTEFIESIELFAKWAKKNASTPSGIGGNGATPSEPSTDKDNSNTSVETKPDGSTVTTEKDSEGNVTVTTENKDGSVSTEVKTEDGTVATTTVEEGKVEAEVEISDKSIENAIEKDVVIELPISAVPTTKDKGKAPMVEINLPKSVNEESPITVTIPVEEATPGTVAMIVNEDGTTEIIKDSICDENGMTITLDGSATIQIIDNSKDFEDTETHWANTSIDFVTSREIFNGMSETTFEPEAGMTRGMLAQVLYNLENNPDITESSNFSDIESDAWYSNAVNWAAESGYVSGFPDGSFGATETITREQLAVILYRYAGAPETSGEINFADADTVQDYAKQAMSWAIETGVINGMDGTLNPGGTATRAQVATMIQRFCSM